VWIRVNVTFSSTVLVSRLYSTFDDVSKMGVRVKVDYCRGKLLSVSWQWIARVPSYTKDQGTVLEKKHKTTEGVNIWVS